MNKEKVDVLGVGFNTMTYSEIITFLEKKENRTKYICFPDLYNIIRADKDNFLKSIYLNSTLTLPDGKPSQFFLRKKGYKNITTISGYWLCKKLFKSELKHFFYGTSEENLELMKNNIMKIHPKANVLGYKSPPFVLENEIESSDLIKKDISIIKKLNPDIIWIGISSPKQDLLMHYYHSNNTGTVMIGVGAVFDYFAGTAFMGPEWVKKIGLRWFYHLIIDYNRYSSRIFYILKNLPGLVIKHSIKK